MDESIYEEPLPEWAGKFFTGELELGTQLCTKDGRRMGNAHIIEIGLSRFVPETVYTILTDAGNEVRMSASEIDWAFHPPKYVSVLADVLAKFLRKE